MLDNPIWLDYVPDRCTHATDYLPARGEPPHPKQIQEISKMASGWGGPRPNSGGRRSGAGRPRKAADLPPATILGSRWYVFEAHPRAEFLARDELALAGFEVCLPLERIEVVRRGVRDVIARPLFPRYGFVSLDLAGLWMPAAYAEGVKRLFGRRGSERPTPVPAGVVEALLARMDDEGVVTEGPGIVPVSKPPIAVGETVRVLDGPFSSLTGLCQRSSADRVTLLMEIMGARRSVQIRREHVEAA